MAFKSWTSHGDFFREVTRSNRYFYSADVKDFLSNVLETSTARVTHVKLGSILWRAQLGSDWQPIVQNGEEIADEPVPFSPQRMTPVPFEATEGRVNPKGIPCLYLATTKETALAEVRPWLDSNISVGQFKTVKKLKVIDCSVHSAEGWKFYWKEPDDQKKEEAVWSSIDRAFSEPVTPSDKTSDYVPTQIIAELFRSNGFDGVIYRSAVARGKNEYNLALFNIAAATLLNCFLCRVEKIRYSFTESGNGYSTPRSDSGT